MSSSRSDLAVETREINGFRWCRRAAASLGIAGTAEHFAHVPVLILVAGIGSPLVPAVIASKLPQMAGGDDLRFVDVLGPLTVGCDVQGVRLTIQFAHVARLAIHLPRDDGISAGHGLEHVARTGSHTRVALRAPVLDEKGNQAAASEACVSPAKLDRIL